MELKKVLYISQEIEPYLPAGNLSTFGRKLAQGIHEGGTEVRTFMPRYSAINERRNQLHEVIRLSGINIIIDDTDHPLIIKVATLLPTRMQVYFIDNNDYFLHHGDGTLETDSMPAVNDERSIFFVRGTVDTVRKLRWDPSVIHCIGWISALAPLYLKRAYADDPSFRSSKIVYSLYDKRFDGTLDPRMVEKLRADGFSEADLASLTDGGELVDFIKLNKLAIDHADAVAVSSEGVEPELIEYARASGKPLFEYTAADDGFADAYREFYKSL